MELDGVALNREIDVGDRSALALYEIGLIGQADFGGARGLSAGAYAPPWRRSVRVAIRVQQSQRQVQMVLPRLVRPAHATTVRRPNL